MRKATLAALVFAVLSGSRLAAQPLAEHVPQEAIFYVGWQGADSLGPAYEQSTLKKVIGATEMAKLTSQMIESVKQAATDQAQGDPDAQAAAEFFSVIGPASWKYGTALFMLAPDKVVAEESGAPIPQLAVLWKAGAEAPALLENVKRFADKIREAQTPLRVFQAGDLVVLAVGFGDESPVLAGLGDKAQPSIARDAAFAAALKNSQPDAVFTAYLSGTRLLQAIDETVAAESQPQDAERWTRVRVALGLSGFKGAIATGGFVGPDWGTQVFIDAPAPRQGLLALVDSPALGDKELGIVPQTATWANLTRMDVGKLFDLIRKTVQEADAQAGTEFDAQLKEASAQVGVDLEADVIRALGTAWVLYTDPAVAGPGGIGLCLVNQPADPAKLNQALVSLEKFANTQMAQGAAQNPMGPQVRFQVAQMDDLSVHTLAFPFFSPSWAVHGENLYVALLPQAVITAKDYATQKDASILKNEKFLAVRKQLGAANETAIVFMDLPQSAPAVYQNYLMLTQTLSSLIAMQGGPQIPMMLPPLSKIMPLLKPAGSVTWVDAAGLHMKAVTPFPGSSLLSPQAGIGSMTTSAPLAVGILLPALGAARRTAHQMQGNTQARGIEQAQITFAQGNDNKYTNDIAQLVEGNFFTIDYCIAPHSGIEPPAEFQEWPAERQSAWVRENASFVLIPDLTDDVGAPRQVAVFLRPEHSDGRILSVAFTDGSAAAMPVDEVRALVLKQTGKTLEELTQRQMRFGQAPEPVPAQAPAPAPR